jgi:hypothetical protein
MRLLHGTRPNFQTHLLCFCNFIRMRIFSVIFLLFISFAFTGNETSFGLIIPGEQAGPVKLGYTTIEEAKDTLNIPYDIENISAIWRTCRGLRYCTKDYYYEYRLDDSTKGISIYAKFRDLHVVTEIRLAAPCKWKTKENFGIGTSFDEIKNKLGIPDDEADSTSNHPMMSKNMYHVLKYSDIYFYSFYDKENKIPCCVDEIVIRCKSIQRKNTGPASKFVKRVKQPPPCVKC